uniref:Uncharacterized protein n=1 Tax=Aegilops tauschii TaxID=37682 RepID=R7W5L4_AEGTA
MKEDRVAASYSHWTSRQTTGCAVPDEEEQQGAEEGQDVLPRLEIRYPPEIRCQGIREETQSICVPFIALYTHPFCKFGASKGKLNAMVKKKSSWSQVVSGRPTNLFVPARNLPVQDLGAVIFGCTNNTIAECHSRQLFGLPKAHLSYVHNIKEGLPLFLFNYDDRRLHGVYEAASNGKFCPESNAWTNNGYEKTSYPAQFWTPPVSQPGAQHVSEPTPPPVWVQKFEGNNELKAEKVLVSYADAFWTPPVSQPGAQHVSEPTPPPVWVQKFEGNNELKAEKVLVSYADAVKQSKFEVEGVGLRDVDDGRNNEWNNERNNEWNNEWNNERNNEWNNEWNNERNNELKPEKVLPEKGLVSYADMVKQNKFEVEGVGMADVDNGHASSSKESSNGFDDLDCKETPPEWEDHALFSKGVEVQQQQQSAQQENELSFTLVLEKLKALSVQQLSSEFYANGAGTEGIDAYGCKDMQEVKGTFLEGHCGLPENLDTEVDQLAWEHSSLLLQGLDYESYSEAKLIDVVKGLSERIETMEKKQIISNKEVKCLQGVNDRLLKRVVELKNTVKNLNSKIDPLSLDDSLNQFVEECLGSEDVIYLIGGFDGISFLSSLDSFSPSLDILTPLKPMTAGKSYTSAVALDGKIFVLGGGDGACWFDTVDCYDRRRDDWTPCPALTHGKGSLAGVGLHGKIYAFGGGDGICCFSDMEVFDPAQGKWTKSHPMLEKRFSLAGTELNGVIYAVGGFNGVRYLSSAERLDPREPNWKMLPAMSTVRGCHTVAVLDEKIYVMGGYDADAGAMVSTVEVYEPRMPSWVMVEPMNYTRGYHSSAVLGGSIFTLGGVKGEADTILDVGSSSQKNCVDQLLKPFVLDGLSGGALQGRLWLGEYRDEVNRQQMLLLCHCSLTDRLSPIYVDTPNLYLLSKYSLRPEILVIKMDKKGCI